VLKKASPKLRKAILKSAPDELIKAITEIAYNILNGNHRIGKKYKDNLKKYKSQLRKLSQQSNSLRAKRKILVQSGGSFLPYLLSTVLTGIIGKLLEQHV
jgi:hypothetical protein